MSEPGWTIVGAPLDSAAAGEGEERAPAALRAAGLLDALAADDAGDVTGLLRPAERDPATGVIAFEAVCAACAAVRDAVAELLGAGRRPLVVGGDCAFLPGALAGCRVAGAGAGAGLWMVDGHPDALDGDSSPTGEAADMDLAIALGRGPAGLVDLAGAPPLVTAQRVAVLGLRPLGTDPDNDAEIALLPDAVWWRDAPSILAAGPRAAGEAAAERLAGGRAWLHVDLDALDEAVMPAVSYPQPHGLTWEALEQLLEPLAGSPALLGASVSDLNVDRDHDGAYARRTVELLARVLAP